MNAPPHVLHSDPVVMSTTAERSLALRTGSLAAGQMAVKGSQMVIAVGLVRLLAPEDWSRVALLLTIHLAITTLGTLNLHQSLLFFLPRVDRDGQRTLVSTTAGAMFGLGLLSAALLSAASPWLSGGRLDVRGWIPWLAVAITFELPTACASVLLIGLDRVRDAALWDIGWTVAQITTVVGSAAIGLGVGGVIGALVTVAVGRLAGLVTLIHCLLPRGTTRVPRVLIVEQVKFSVPLGLTIGASVLNRTVDKWFVAAFDPGDLGVYTIAAQEIPLLAVLPVAGGAAMAAHLVDAFHRQDHEEARNLWFRQTSMMSRLVVPLSAGMILITPEVFPVVFSKSMSAGVVPFQVFTAITLHRVAEYGVLLRAAGRTRDLFMAAFTLLGANAVLAGLGAAAWGMTGAALGTLVANALAWWLVLGRIADALQTDRLGSFCWGTWGRCLLTSGLATALATVIVIAVDVEGGAATLVKLMVFVPLIVLMDSWTKAGL